jgi:hypothetical protein
MTSYFLFTQNQSHVFQGSYAQCGALGDQLVRCGKFEHLNIARLRAGEPRARLIFQITPENRSQCRGVRTVDAKTLLRTSKVSPLCGVDHG